MKAKLFIPVVPSGASSSQNRQKFIKQTQAFIIENDLPKKIYYPSHIKLKIMVNFLYKGELVKDIDNSLKALFDALKGHLFYDDVQIRDLHARIKINQPKVGIEIRMFNHKQL